jgi:hypothetical protein
MIKAVLTITIDYPEGEKDSIDDVSRQLDALPQHLASKGHFSVEDLLVGTWDHRTEVKFEEGIQTELPFQYFDPSTHS